MACKARLSAMFPTLINALRETLFMVLSASLMTILIGIPLGIFIANLAAVDNKPVRGIYYIFFSLMHLAKFIPYLLIMLLFIPLMNWLINKHYSYSVASVIPLATAGILLLAHRIYTATFSLYNQWQATGKAMGASKFQTFWLIILPESLPEIITASSKTCALMVGFSTIGGALGAGGLGQLAIEKSINQTDPLVVLSSIAILVVLQQLIEYTGNIVVRQTQPR